MEQEPLTQTIEFAGQTLEIPIEWEVVESYRGFDYPANDGCWILAKTPFIEKENTHMYYLKLDHGGFILEDPQLLACWDI